MPNLYPFRRLIVLAIAAAPLVMTLPAHAQQGATPTPLPMIVPFTATPAPTAIPVVLATLPASASVSMRAEPPPAALMSTPGSARLDGLRMVYQQFNRCSAAALTMQLSFFGWQGSYDDAIRGLNPNIDDVAVRLDEMAAFARSYGYGAIEGIGGTPGLLKALVAAGFPVLVEFAYYDGDGGDRDWMSHNRVVMGYDDAAGVFLTYDSLLGAGDDGQGRPVPYDVFDERWRAFNRDYLIVYWREQEMNLRAMLGAHWDANANAEWALAQNLDAVDAGTADNFTYFNLGETYAALGRYQEAADAFDSARRAGLPFRVWWYQYGVFEAYLALGRNQDVLDLGRSVVQTSAGVEEIYYYLGRAYEQMGDVTSARANYEASAWRNPSFTPAVQAAARLGA